MRIYAYGILLLLLAFMPAAFAQRQMEYLDRAFIAIPAQNGGVYLSWRLLADDKETIAFNIYKAVSGNKEVKLNAQPIIQTTDFTDSLGNSNSTYVLKAIMGTKENKQANTKVQSNAYLSIPLHIPPSAEVNGTKYTYSANDVSVGDVDGDGQYEIFLKWDPSNSKNPPQTGFTGNQLIDAYKMDGTFLWRIDLGINIRSGAAYTQFLVYDFDGDGKAELVCKTADGTTDGIGKKIGDAKADWRNDDKSSPMYGKIVKGPEYLTVFNGATGAAMHTVTYLSSRYPLDGWGGIGGNGGNDEVGSRPDRFTACVAYLDGQHPSMVMVRGWYGRSVLAAWDFKQGKLNHRWTFDSKDATSPYSGMGNHNLSVADVDQDGKDEICIGAMTVDDNGKGLYTTGLRHGDALHLTDLDPDRPGLEVYGIHESEGKTLALKTPGVAMFDAATGEIIWSKYPGIDVGRGVAADIDPNHPGFENWGGPGGLRDVKGNTISEKGPSSTNFLVWWDADLTRELLDKNHIDKWNWQTQQTDRLFTADDCTSNNGTKATPCLSGDILGDWREEVMWRTADNKELRIYSTNIPAKNRMVTLMHDPQYRLSIAWQNVAYNQPPHTGFYLGNGMKNIIKPDIKIIKTKK